MIIGEDTFWRNFQRSRKYSAEEDFYLRLVENHVYPFEDLGNGFYYLRLRSGRCFAGLSIIIFSCLAGTYFFLATGIYSFPVCVLIIFIILGFMCLIGKVTTEELIISRQAGYLLRMAASRKVIVEQDIYNVYIRLQKKMDSVQNHHCYLIIGGYLLDDIRISRMTPNEAVMRSLGRYLARNLGINYFDYHDETVRHCVYHFRGYSTMQWTQKDVDVLFNYENESKFQIPSEDNLAVGFSAATTRRKSGPIARKTLTRINLRSQSRITIDADTKTLKAAQRRKIERAQRRRNRKDWKAPSGITVKAVKSVVGQLTRRQPERPRDTI